ncbi:hypothetical protein EDEG_04000 [Edhazardia aedis USNM 41457]|uniref:Uncharacterized protein n=1 Tax=Edhazardia aedis (strain USNM 41457) TaxID=1003232 RepID=J9DJ07_EDHAE|nr:hypothetical protein EDEG_04000 [Edhazardia aedis USNM 41457]|eukprot:EJW01372.1 hypothetical protein EDEG_04000 [Edhazardia aedis USNM 41457]
MILLVKKDNSDVICKLYRKSDILIREQIRKIMGEKYFLNLTDPANIFIIFNIENVDYEKLIQGSIKSMDFQYSIEILKYLINNGIKEELKIFYKALLENGCFQVISKCNNEIEFLDKEKHETLYFILNNTYIKN